MERFVHHVGSRPRLDFIQDGPTALGGQAVQQPPEIEKGGMPRRGWGLPGPPLTVQPAVSWLVVRPAGKTPAVLTPADVELQPFRQSSGTKPEAFQRIPPEFGP